MDKNTLPINILIILILHRFLAPIWKQSLVKTRKVLSVQPIADTASKLFE